MITQIWILLIGRYAWVNYDSYGGCEAIFNFVIATDCNTFWMEFAKPVRRLLMFRDGVKLFYNSLFLNPRPTLAL
jgi:hypothetical protein